MFASLPLWVGAVACLSLAQVITGIFSLAVGQPTPNAFPWDAALVAVAVVNLAAAVPLLLGGRSDGRALFLGAAFLASASAFSLRPIAYLSEGRFWVGALGSIQLETLLPFFMWRFVRDFPRTKRYDGRTRLAGIVISLSLGLGVILLFAAGIQFILDPSRAATPPTILDWARREGPFYWPLILGLLAWSFIYATAQAREAPLEERRRVALLFAGVAASLAPILVSNLLWWTLPQFRSFFDTPTGARVTGLMVFPTILVGPLIIAYAVLVRRALDIRLFVRKALQYALARYSLAALTAVPFIGLVAFLYANRQATLADLIAGRNGLLLAAAVLLGLIALSTRRHLLRSVDRVFFRERYDAREIMSGVVDEIRRSADAEALANLVVLEVGRALHPSETSLLLLPSGSQELSPAVGTVRPLSLQSELVRRLAEQSSPLEIDWDKPDARLTALPMTDVTWLSDGNVHLIVPVLSGNHRVIGLLLLGDRLSELPYSSEDRALLSTIANSLGLELENRRLRGGMQLTRRPPDAFAGECEECGLVGRRDALRCTECGGPVRKSAVPAVLAGKYRLQQRIGSGGMGVVYRGLDIELEREVAIKTLPRMAPGHAQRLRREARTIAALSHPHLALIYATESWHGTPLLVLEYLPGGTLSDRINRGPLPPAECIRLGVALAGVTEELHERGILHRDIKPSNIGFDGKGTLKLMDFGVSRILAASVHGGDRDKEPRAAARDLPTEVDPSTTVTYDGALVGTVLYMSPEALDGEPPSPAMDLWSIAIVLYEAMTGLHPFAAPNSTVAMSRIMASDPPDIRNLIPWAPNLVADFFKDALSHDIGRRPPTAKHLRATLQQLYETLPSRFVTSSSHGGRGR